MKSQSFHVNKEQEEEADKGEAETTQLNTEELDKLKAFLRRFKMEEPAP